MMNREDQIMQQKNVKVIRGLYVGRFQPYHLGHQEVIKKISKEVDEIIIVIGSAEESHTIKDPFTAGERVVMICNSLGDLRGKCYVIPLRNINRFAVWVAHLLSMVPKFDIVYSNNHLVTQLFEESGFEVRKSPMFDRTVMSGTRIRQMMKSGENWSHLVPREVLLEIEKVRGVERLKKIMENDI